MTWVLDLDGVVWLGGQPLPGAADAIRRLRAAGERLLFLTNNSGPRLAEHTAKLRAAGVDAEEDEVVSSAHAAAALLAPGIRAYVLGGPGVTEALERRGVIPTDDPDEADAVVVGRTEDFDYPALAAATRAVRNGARYIGTNDDATYPTPEGMVPGAGAILAAVTTAGGRPPEVAGKPYPPTVALVRQLVGEVGTVVGDRPDTDGLLARGLGARFVLVLTGVTAREDLPVDPAPDEVAADLAAAVPR
ncbi:MAG: hypothetical protein QOG64_725 [Acidimicrobiaceae bacterium]|jgi:4-nitrophenyl phosphatase|nr:hypothetical protein [Acidimicrobiaceae bacterium]